MAELSIANIVNVSVAATPTGLSAFNADNILLFTTETPDPVYDGDYKIYLEPDSIAADFGTSSITYAMANAAFGQQPNFLAGGGYFAIAPFEPSETLDAAIARLNPQLQFVGTMSTQIESQADALAAAAVVEPLNKILMIVQKTAASVQSGGTLDLLRTGNFHKSRGLLYIGDDVAQDSLVMMSSYLGRAMAVNFDGNNTTLTMQLKDLGGVQPDNSLDQTIFTDAQTAGADVYANIQGIAKCLTSGANHYWDQVHNLCWFVGTLQVAYFNALAQTATKIPQTEEGVDVIRKALTGVCQQAVRNAYAAPGVWNSSTTFGNQVDLLQNIQDYGFYVYITPIAQQSQAQREARVAPVAQIALKEAGAMHKGSVIVNLNA